MKENAWKDFRYRLELASVEFLAWLIPKLSRRACVRLADALGSLAFALDRRGRAVSLANLEVAFGNRFDAEEKKRIARSSYQTFIRTMLDLLWAQRLTRENYTKYIHIEHVERLTARRQANPSGEIFIWTHLSNFEWTHMSLAFQSQPGLGVAETFKNPLLTKIFTRLRGVAGNEVVEQERSFLRFFKQLKKHNGIVGMLIDLTLRPTQPSVIIDTFGGLKMCVTFMHAELHRRTGAPLYPLEAIPCDDGGVRIIVHEPLIFPPEMSAQQITQACWDFFEPRIRERPEHWMWVYKHWRYKPADATRAYPFYANVSSKFEKLRKAQAAAAK